jgi:hypothetical protein
MATTWTETATEICRDALEHIGAVGAGETVSADDQQVALRALDWTLKELPLHGYHWPKLSTETALTWSAIAPQTITLPADYYDFPLVRKTVDGETVPLHQIPHSTWVGMTGREDTATEPTHFYISPARVLYFWPVPTVDPVAKIQYQKIVDDAALATTPDVIQTMKPALGYGVADALALKFDVPERKALQIKARWDEKREMVLQSAISSEPVEISGAD